MIVAPFFHIPRPGRLPRHRTAAGRTTLPPVLPHIPVPENGPQTDYFCSPLMALSFSKSLPNSASISARRAA